MAEEAVNEEEQKVEESSEKEAAEGERGEGGLVKVDHTETLCPKFFYAGTTVFRKGATPKR